MNEVNSPDYRGTGAVRMKEFLAKGLLRAWLAFVIAASLSCVALLVLYGFDRELYGVGFLAGAFAAALAVVYTFYEQVSNRWKASIGYFVSLGAWCAFLLLAGVVGISTGGASEGGLLSLFLVPPSLLLGVVSWLLFLRQPPWWLVAGAVLLTMAGVALIGMERYTD